MPDIFDKIDMKGIRIGELGKSLTKLHEPDIPKLPKIHEPPKLAALLEGAIDGYVKAASAKGLHLDRDSVVKALSPRVQKIILSSGLAQ